MRLLITFFLVITILESVSAKTTLPFQTSISTICNNNDTLPFRCAKNDEIERIIDDAISIGAPIYNDGMHIACYRVYEWAAYKILYEYGGVCKDIEKILKAAVEKSHGDISDTEKAWLMRVAFDKILGVPTITGETEKINVPRKG